MVGRSAHREDELRSAAKKSVGLIDRQSADFMNRLAAEADATRFGTEPGPPQTGANTSPRNVSNRARVCGFTAVAYSFSSRINSPGSRRCHARTFRARRVSTVRAGCSNRACCGKKTVDRLLVALNRRRRSSFPGGNGACGQGQRSVGQDQFAIEFDSNAKPIALVGRRRKDC